MRILHIVTYVSPDGSFGGPVKVALGQAKVLSKLGHDVVVIGAAGGFNRPLPKSVGGVKVKLFPGRKILPRPGFASMMAPGMLTWLLRESKNFDVVHIHFARDLVTLPAAAIVGLFKVPIVLQTHGMVTKTGRRTLRALDILATVPLLRNAKEILCLTIDEKRDLEELVQKDQSFRIVPNGIDAPILVSTEQKSGPSGEPEVLFLGRLHSRKRPLFLVRAAAQLTHVWPSAKFTLVGPDEGEAQSVMAEITAAHLNHQVAWEGALPMEKTNSRLSEASILVLPSVKEPFGMSVIEGMALGLPVVITDSCGLASTVKRYKAGIVCDESQEDFTKAIGTLLADPVMRMQMGIRAREIVMHNFSIDVIGSNLQELYRASVLSSIAERRRAG